MKKKNENNEEYENIFQVLKRNCDAVPQFKALLKLIGWAIFFIFIFIIGIIGKIKTNVKEERTKTTETTTTKVVDEKESYKDIVNKLIKDNKEYKFDIKIDNKELSIKGKINNDVFDGYFETNDETKHFQIKDENVYIIKGNNEEKVDTLYKGLDSYIIYPIRLVNILINNLSTKINKDGVFIHEYKDIKIGDNTYQIKAYEDSSNINKIEFINGDNSYLISLK